MYNILFHAHSGIRYLVLLMVCLTVLKALVALISKSKYSGIDNKLSLSAMALTHLQLLLGFLLYFVSPVVKVALKDMGAAMKDEALRFVAVEHVSIMILAVIAITFGRILAKKAPTDNAKHLKTLVLFGVALVLIVIGIPWSK